MQTRPLEKADYDRIVSVIDAWWEGPTSALAHPIFFYELGRLARVVVDGDELVGFLLGFVAPETRVAPEAQIAPGSAADGAPTEVLRTPCGYVHLVGIHPEHRRRGVARLLYAAFEDDCQAAGCRRLKAITTLGNEGSVRFHEALGWRVSEVEDYAGRGRTRLVFEKSF
jgi:GNAT superfamily N-acetyltransferase